jgi:hypothetical protein
MGEEPVLASGDKEVHAQTQQMMNGDEKTFLEKAKDLITG